ncbi:MAG: 1,4-alpha-glucan branching protein GlgB [Betaproteobacteria bacterium]|nr:1,4-alpha-glucan branching protein GlgB [Betaproteobacteria bacterium]
MTVNAENAPGASPLPWAMLTAGREHNPHACLGLAREDGAWRLRCWLPQARTVALLLADTAQPMRCVDAAGVFEWRGELAPCAPWKLLIDEHPCFDPYAFAPEPPELALHLFNEGRNRQAYTFLGAQLATRLGICGTVFRVWAPTAERVSVIGDFNAWDGRCHPMASLGPSGVWELFLPGLAEDALYKFEIRTRAGALRVKTDPYGRAFERRPATAAKVPAPVRHAWGDTAWLARREAWDWLHAPIAVYEVHLGSWRRRADGGFLGYQELAQELVPYARELGCTHLELLPLCEHPLDESWGYQSTGYFAPTARHGTPDELRGFIDVCHQAGLGVLLDWTPGHFPEDDFALAHFDGSSLYEHEDPRLKRHPDWGTHVFNYGRKEVQSFLLSSAYYWLREFHFDGLRVDAVASMLYLDYSRQPGEWLPNRYGGRENLEAIEFLRELNVMVHSEFPGAITVAEESTAWPMVSRPVHLGGLGFSMKWNMGWMNDTLTYLRLDPIHRRYHHNRLTFGQVYAYAENFLLPLSHDEVVHGKSALLAKMPGDDWQRFANLRTLLVYQFTSPGKKLLFMGAEFGQRAEWNSQAELQWTLADFPPHAGLRHLARDLFGLYRELDELHELDFEAAGFQWSDCYDADQSVISFLRKARDGRHLLVILNFTPLPRHAYEVGVPSGRAYREILNSDSRHYGGGDLGNGGLIPTRAQGRGEFPASLSLTLPPLAGLVLRPE